MGFVPSSFVPLRPMMSIGTCVPSLDTAHSRAVSASEKSTGEGRFQGVGVTRPSGTGPEPRGRNQGALVLEQDPRRCRPRPIPVTEETGRIATILSAPRRRRRLGSATGRRPGRPRRAGRRSGRNRRSRARRRARSPWPPSASSRRAADAGCGRAARPCATGGRGPVEAELALDRPIDVRGQPLPLAVGASQILRDLAAVAVLDRAPARRARPVRTRAWSPRCGGSPCPTAYSSCSVGVPSL